jgi:putative (di)nucleoside polyphosphate hydrolase
MPEGIAFRAGVGMLVVNAERRVLALERSGRRGAWQAPQGGIMPKETPIEAAERELREETGIAWRSVRVVAEHPLWLGYELPDDAQSEKTGRGQVHKWFLLEFQGLPRSIRLPTTAQREFGAWHWVPMDELIESTWKVRRPIYARLAQDWESFLR